MSSSEYQKLKKKWYAKLEKSGFNDIEQDDGYGNLKVWSHVFARTPGLLEKQEYSIMATHFLNDYEFANKKDRVIWTYHTEAISYRDITQLMKSLRFKVSEMFVLKRIQALRQIMFELYGVTSR